ncbi:hypothetical protein Sste5346_002209 [Sporothrix stenoceras]|uniref:Uncharacterized protein n=1 Tax=Sporothrix stenoceras TaxID=5173 RepID=A0ABR3ZIF8_9PEZI
MSTQHDRDLRSAHIDYKRNKDQLAKWEHGARGLHIAESGPLREGTTVESFRPCKPLVRYWVMPNNNIQKPFRGNRTNLPVSRHRETSQALKELQESKKMTTSDILLQAPAQPVRSPPTPLDGPPDLVYSYDLASSPATALTLDAFIKTPSARSTEKMIKNEYEVVDANGEAVHGRKARQVLREAAASSNSPVTKPKLIEVVDEDDFELI